MTFARLSLSILSLVLLCNNARADDVLATLRKEHPRLLVSLADFQTAKQNAANNPQAAVYYRQIKSDCEKFLDQSPVMREEDSKMLAASRTALGRITFLAALYRMDGDKRFADRARDEMLAAAKFSDWNPAHFLDVAEMTAAMSIGYDWLFDALSPEDRAAIRGAIVDKGLKAGLAAYSGNAWWTTNDHNWATVCAGGLALGALAVADEEPDISRQILERTRKTMELPLTVFKPDGGLPEGPAYWDYETKYTIFYIAAAETALGNDLGMAKTEGLDKTGFFRIYTTGPFGKSFNTGDANEFPGNASQMFWLATHFHQPIFASAERDFVSNWGNWGDAFHLLWFNGDGASLSKSKLPLDAMFANVEVASFRSAWDDRHAFFVGFKGGFAGDSHGHLDLGSFVLDAFGQRWASDLGGDSYDLPGYFGRERWDYYRTRTEGHNTLTVNGANQDLHTHAPIIAFASTPQRALAVVDMSAAYASAGAKVRRGIELLDRNAVVVEDEVEAKSPVKIQWGFHTTAGIQLRDGQRSADLTQGGESITARIISPPDAVFGVIGADPGRPQKANRGVSNLVIVLEKATSARIVVVLAKKEIGDQVKDVPELEEWIAFGKK